MQPTAPRQFISPQVGPANPSGCSPAALVVDVAGLLGTKGFGIEFDQIAADKAFTLAALLLIEFGIEPEIAADEHSRAAENIRELIVENRTRIKTKPRRAL